LDIGASVAARLAEEMRFEVGQAQVVWPLIGADGD
jgi:hypothetical protein